MALKMHHFIRGEPWNLVFLGCGKSWKTVEMSIKILIHVLLLLFQIPPITNGSGYLSLTSVCRELKHPPSRKEIMFFVLLVC